jgi:TRAP-type C4-dicarboxylate transport system permease small subunit
MAYTHFAGANVKVTMLTQILPEKLQNFIEVLTCLMSLVIMATLTWYGGISGIEDMHAGTTTDNLGLPTFPIYWLLSVGAGLLSLVILVRLMTHFLGVFGIEVPKKAA